MSFTAMEQFSTAVSPVPEIYTASGLLLGTPVLSMDGELPVEYLQPGDRVLTRNGMRRIASIEVTRVQNARVVQISPDSFGIGRPADAITVAPQQGILVRDWRAMALFGKPEAVVPAARLCDGEFVRGDILAEARFVALRFAAPEVIYAGGIEVLCDPATVDA